VRGGGHRPLLGQEEKVGGRTCTKKTIITVRRKECPLPHGGKADSMSDPPKGKQRKMGERDKKSLKSLNGRCVSTETEIKREDLTCAEGRNGRSTVIAPIKRGLGGLEGGSRARQKGIANAGGAREN